ncbi:VWD domain-containing protein, partial [Rhodothermus profundi]
EGALCFFWPLTAAIPQEIAAVPGDGSVVLTWQAARGALSYNVYLAAEPGVTKANWHTKTEGRQLENVRSPLVITGLRNDQPYYFVVTAVGVRGESRESNEVQAVPQPSPFAAPGPRSGRGLGADSVRLGPPLQGKTLVAHDGAVAIIIAPQELTLEPGEMRTLGVWLEDADGNRFAGSADYLEVVVAGQGWRLQWAAPGNLQVEAPAAGAGGDSVLVLEVRSSLLADSTYYAGQALVRLVRIRPEVVVVPEERVVWPTSYPLSAEEQARREELFSLMQWEQAEALSNTAPGLVIGVVLREDTSGLYQVGQRIVSKGEGFSLGGQIEHVVARNDTYVLLRMRLLPLEALYVSYPFPDPQQILQRGLSPFNPNAVRLILEQQEESLYKKPKSPCQKSVKLRVSNVGSLITVSLISSFNCSWPRGNSGVSASFTVVFSVGLQTRNWTLIDTARLYRSLITLPVPGMNILSFASIAALLDKIDLTLSIDVGVSLGYFLVARSEFDIEGLFYAVPLFPGTLFYSLGRMAGGMAISVGLGKAKFAGLKAALQGEDTVSLPIITFSAGVKGSLGLNLGKMLQFENPIQFARVEPYVRLQLLDIPKEAGFSPDGLSYYKATVNLLPLTVGPLLGFFKAQGLITPGLNRIEKKWAVIQLGVSPYLTIAPQGLTPHGAITRGRDARPITKSLITLSAGRKIQLFVEGTLLAKIGGEAALDLLNLPLFEVQIGDVKLGGVRVNTEERRISGILEGYSDWADPVFLYHLKSAGSNTSSAQPHALQLSEAPILLGTGERTGNTFAFTYDDTPIDCSVPEGGRAYLLSFITIPILNFSIPLGYSYLGAVDLCDPEFALQPASLNFTGRQGDRLQKTTQAIARSASMVTVTVLQLDGPFTMIPLQATISRPDTSAAFTVHTECTGERLNQRLTGRALLAFDTGQKQVRRTLSIALSCQNNEDDPDENPPITGDLPPARASSWGDPHLTTFDRLSYDFHAIGDYLAARSMLPGDLFEIQVRHKPFGSSNRVSGNAALAANVEGHRVEIYHDSAATFPAVWINGQRIEGTHWTQSLSGGGSVVARESQVVVSWKDGSALTVWQRGIILDYQVLINGFRRGYLIGLLGDGDGNPGNDLRLKDGTILPTTREKDLYLTPFRDDWRIPLGSKESLFSQGPDLYTPFFPDPDGLFTLEDLPEELRAWAELTCRLQGIVTTQILQACMLDVAITRDPKWAASSLGVDPNVPGVHTQPRALLVPLGSPDRTHQIGALVTGVEDKTLFWEGSAGLFIQQQTNNRVAVSVPDVEGVYEVRAYLASDSSIKDVAYVLVRPPTYAVWTGAGDGRSFSDCANWLNNQCPGPNNDVYLLVSRPVTIDLDGREVYALIAQGPITFKGNLTLRTGGELRHRIDLSASQIPPAVAAQVSVSEVSSGKTPPLVAAQDAAIWEGGTLTIHQGALQLYGKVRLRGALTGTLINHGQLTLPESGSGYILTLQAGSQLENRGIIEQIGRLLIRDASVQLRNLGTWILREKGTDRADLLTLSSSVTASFTNQGHMVYQTSGTTNWSNLNFTHEGMLEVQSGTWTLQGGHLTLADSATLIVADSATLFKKFGSLTSRMRQPTPIAGTFRLENATLQTSTTDFTQNGLELRNVALDGRLINHGRLQLSRSIASYDLTLQPGSHLENHGTFEQIESRLRITDSSAQIQNFGSWTFTGTHGSQLFTSSNSIRASFTNQGRIIHQAAGTTSWSNFNFTHEGVLEIRNGTWSWARGELILTDSAILIVADSAALIKGGGTVTLTIPQPMPIAGSFRLQNTTLQTSTTYFTQNGLELRNV